MSISINWKGNQHTNSSSREGEKPLIIVNHISSGSMSSMDAWFTSPDNGVSSAHFGISKKGEIHQYVKIESMAWSNGLNEDHIPLAPAAIVREKGINPNLYSISIEHEGMYGDLTEKQFNASIAVHRYIKDYVALHLDSTILFDRRHILGHYQINPTNKANCPGPEFPWEKLYAELVNIDDTNEQLQKLQQLVTELSERLNVIEQQQFMETVPEWAEKSVNKALIQGIVNTPIPSSYDFFRFLTLLDRKQLLD